MVASNDPIDLPGALARVATALESVDLAPDGTLAAERDRLAAVVRSYLIPKTANPSSPLIVVFAGPTGSGKSTLTNTLAELDVCPTGVLRPTTDVPVVLTKPGDIGQHEAIGGVPCQVVAGGTSILESMVLVDTPDIDSTSIEHRAMAETLLDSADVVVFVTSALRYADEVPWQVLRRAVSRGAPVVNVLNRVGSATSGAIVGFKSRLASAGLDNDLITVPEHHLDETARRVPSPAVTSLRQRLGSLISDRDEFTRDVFQRVLASTIAHIDGLAITIAQRAAELEAFEADLAVDLAGRASELSLDGVGAGIYPPPPARPSPRSARRWKRAARSSAAVNRGFEMAVADRIVAQVHTDVRRCLLERSDHFGGWGIEPAPVTRTVAEVARSAVGDWLGVVSGIVADHDQRASSLGEAVLVDAATSGQSGLPAVEIMFGDAGAVLVARARSDLEKRIDSIYGLARSLVAGMVARRHRVIDGSELKACLGAVRSTHAPVHA